MADGSDRQAMAARSTYSSIPAHSAAGSRCAQVSRAPPTGTMPSGWARPPSSPTPASSGSTLKPASRTRSRAAAAANAATSVMAITPAVLDDKRCASGCARPAAKLPPPAVTRARPTDATRPTSADRNAHGDGSGPGGLPLYCLDRPRPASPPRAPDNPANSSQRKTARTQTLTSATVRYVTGPAARTRCRRRLSGWAPAIASLMAAPSTRRHRVRFAIKTRPEHTTWAEIRDVWLAADEITVFESAWNWDHFYPLTGDLSGPNLEGWTMLAALAQATSRIRLGCQVTGMIYRHPAVLANMAATVDIISGGRLELGLGAGWNSYECDAYGIDLPPLRERFDRFDEGVEAIVRLLTQETTTFPGRFVRLTEARGGPLRAEAGPAAASSGHHRRPRPYPHAADRRAMGTAVERDHRQRGRVAQPQGDTVGTLRSDRPRPR